MGTDPNSERGTRLSARARDWPSRLARELRAARRLFVLGVGNRDRADDGAGSLCLRRLRKKLEAAEVTRGKDSSHSLPRESSRSPGARRLLAVKILDGGEVPESATGVIREFRPTHVLIIDAVVGGHDPGTIFFVSRNKIPQEDLTTHRLPLSHLIRYLEETVGCRVIVMGIEPADLSAGRPMSGRVRKAAETLADGLAQLGMLC
jgi:hydrogenase 3 maturation protease